MAYSKHTWMQGEIITADKLNSVENGIDCVANCAALWRNDHPTAEFSAQSITANTDAYNTFELCFLIDIGGAWHNIVVRLTKSRAYATDGEYISFVKYGNYERRFRIKPGEIVFDDCVYGISYNGKLIPYSIHAFV